MNPLSEKDSKILTANIKNVKAWLPDPWRQHKHSRQRFENGNRCLIVRLDKLSYYKDFRELLSGQDHAIPLSEEELLWILENH